MRLVVVPDPQLAELAPVLAERLASVAARVRPEHLADLLDPALRTTFRLLLDGVGAHEGTLWLADGDALVAAYNTGPDAGRFVPTFRQPLDRGLVSMVYATEQGYGEADVRADARQDRTLDRTLGVTTTAMLAVPFYFGRRLRGVASCVQLERSAPAARTFGVEALRTFELGVATLGELLDVRLLRLAGGA